MDVALLMARVLLAAVFLVAGVAKLADLASSRRAIVAFGLPAGAAPVLGLLLPVAEIAVAVALLPPATAQWGGFGALILLLSFIAAIGVSLARGRTPDCHCFGQLHSRPIGRSTLVRNAFLAIVAAMVAVAGRHSAGLGALQGISQPTTAEGLALLAIVVCAGVLAAQTWLILHLLGQNGRMLLRIERIEAAMKGAGDAAAPPETPAGLPLPGLQVGTPAPTFKLSGLYGEEVTLDSLRGQGRPVLLIFSDPNCGPCSELLPDIGRWQREYVDRVTVAVLSRGTIEANRPKASEHGLTNVLLQEDWEIGKAYLAPGTPSGVVVATDGTIGSKTVGGPDAIRSLMEQTLDNREEPPVLLPLQAPGGLQRRDGAGARLRIGDVAPPLRLPDLDGTIVDLADFNGVDVIVVFWNPRCGYCRELAPRLRAWEGENSEEGPALLLVSTGSAEDNREMGFRSSVLLDESLSVMRAFGAAGTPMGVLVDEKGRIASEMAAGAPAVQRLVTGEAVTSLP